MPAPGAWLLAFLITTAVEVPVVVALTRAADASAPRRAALAVFAQLATHPLVWFVFPYIVGIRGTTATLLAEVWAWAAEAAFYAIAWRGITVTRAAAVSALANGASVLVGTALSGLLTR
jgi:hypothetical protein